MLLKMLMKQQKNYSVVIILIFIKKILNKGDKKMFQVEKEKCTGCGICIKVCPVEAISMSNDKAKIDSVKCTDCGKCVAVCPTQAIYSDKEEKLQYSSDTGSGLGKGMGEGMGRGMGKGLGRGLGKGPRDGRGQGRGGGGRGRS